MSREALVKGAVIREFLLWYEARYGTHLHPAMIERMSEADRALVNGELPAMGIISSTFYPSTLLFAMMDVTTEALSHDERLALAREANEHVVRKLSKGLYAALFRMVASPRLYARHIQRMWNVLHTTGRRAIVIEREGLLYSTISSWPGHHPFLCEVTTETMRVVFEAMGCREVEIERVACVSTGAPECKAIVRYAVI